jgi:hypothetical protein
MRNAAGGVNDGNVGNRQVIVDNLRPCHIGNEEQREEDGLARIKKGKH